MSEMKHTKGPWSVGAKFCVGPVSEDDDQSFGMVIPIADVYGPNREADIQLIAAAPELLGALRDMLAEASGGKKSCGHDYTCVCAGDKARAAIQKATGGAQ